MKTYSAPWGKALITGSVLFVAIGFAGGIGMPYLMKFVTPRALAVFTTWLLPAMVIGAVPFVIRGYQITEDAILIRRLFWTTRLSRIGLKSAEVMPGALKGSLRLFGNGGAFSFTGWYWNKTLGNYRAFVTDQERPVVLRYSLKTIILSPGEPEEFVKNLSI